MDLIRNIVSGGRGIVTYRMPIDHLSVPGCKPEHEDEDSQTKQADCTVFTSIVCSFIASHGTNNDYSNDERSTSRNPKLLRNEAIETNASIVPDEMHWLGDNRDGNMPEDNTEDDAKP
jgi:hypothetical protein